MLSVITNFMHHLKMHELVNLFITKDNIGYLIVLTFGKGILYLM